MSWLRELGSTGISVSALGLGTVKLGRDQGVKYPQGFTIPDDRAASELLARARDLGINLTSVSPETVDVTFEPFVDVTLDVRVESEPGLINISEAGVVNEGDSQVTITGLRASVAAQLDGVYAVARLTQREVQQIADGSDGQYEHSVALALSEPVEGITLPVEAVGVRMQVAYDRTSLVIDSRPIVLSVTPSVSERYIVSIDNSEAFVTSIRLTGPRDQIELIEADPTLVWLTVRVSGEEAGDAVADGGTRDEPIECIRPAGVELAEDLGQVTVNVRERQADP